MIRNLSGMWQMLFPGKLVRYLDVPQNFDPAIGGAFYRHELEELSRGARGARRAAATTADGAARGPSALYNELRRLVRELYDAAPARALEGADLRAVRACCARALVLPVEEATRCSREYRALVAGRRRSRQPLDQARVLLTGSFCEQPPLGLIKTLERSGCYIVDDDFVQVHRFMRSDIPIDGDPLEQPGARRSSRTPSPARRATSTTARRGRSWSRRIARERRRGRAVLRAQLLRSRRCSTSPWPVRAVERAGVPWTAFKYAENNGQFQVIREQAGTFADSIKLWSEA